MILTYTIEVQLLSNHIENARVHLMMMTLIKIHDIYFTLHIQLYM